MSTEALVLTIIGLLCSGTGLVLFTTAPAEARAETSPPAAQVVDAGPVEPVPTPLAVVMAARTLNVPVPVIPTPDDDDEDGRDGVEREPEAHGTPAEAPEDGDESDDDADDVAVDDEVMEIDAPPTVEEAFVDWHRNVGADPARAWRLADDTDRIAHKHTKLPPTAGKVARLLDIVEYETPEVYLADEARDALEAFLRAALGPETRLLWPKVGDLAVGAVSANGMTGPVSEVVRPGFVHTDEAGTEHEVPPVVNRRAS